MRAGRQEPVQIVIYVNRLPSQRPVMARLVALIPPPRYPLLRLSGVYAPHSSWRAAVVAHGRPAMVARAAAPPEAPKKATKLPRVSEPAQQPLKDAVRGARAACT